MIRLLRPLLAVLLTLAAPAVLGASLPAAASSSDEERQILVMLKMPPAHYRPNSSYSGDYGDAAGQAARRRSARRIAERYGVELREGWPMPLLGVDCYLMVVPPGKALDRVIAAVAKEPGVAWAQRTTAYAISGKMGAADDPLYSAQPTAGEWKLRELQRSATGRGVKIAIVDSRVDVSHPDLAGQFVSDENFIGGSPGRPEAHGTHVAGLIGAKAGNGIGMAGVAPGARLMALRACRELEGGRTTVCNSLALAQALQFAIQHQANVINLSLSGPRDELLGRLLGIALSRNIAVVAAYDQAQPDGGFPASMRGVLPVADEALPSLPSGVYGAPGRDLPTTEPGGGWGLVNGTSYAVAQVSGLVALAGERTKRPLASSLVRASDGRVAACATVLGSTGPCP
uniref:S8 family peptidase n=1 Tax=Altererythrobacter segetis TaxID=1104773 RepID=UPI001FAFCE6D|nr:S8 family serine peptidase [Altererythrobacter segetis]